MNRIKRRLTPTIKRELIIIIGLNIILFFWFAEVDLLESLVEFAEDHEEWELDEIIPLFFSLSLSLAYFSLRRWAEVTELYNKVKKLSVEDSLTGLNNRRHFLAVLESEIARSQRHEREFTLLIIDIDKFKDVNDRWGHNIGDKVIVRFAEILKRETRKSDTIARWGGEEFIILCPDMDHLAAEQMANKLLTSFREENYDEAGKVTASIGAVCASSGEQPESIIHRADVCLYEGKRTGRDRIVIAA
jgi:diguanylate cyclase (GGDEF)-like protein